MSVKDPDDSIVVIFKEIAIKDEVASLASGRPVFTDAEIVELHYPGSKNWSAHPATSFSHWATDALTGDQVKVTYAERFHRQYRQFKAHATQTKTGTPLAYAAFLTEARRAELRAQNIYTVEALAHIDGQELKNLGQGGRDMKNAAMEYIAETQKGAGNAQMQAELEALRAVNTAMAEDLAMLKAQSQADDASKVNGDEFEGMDLPQLREFITVHTGQAPLGALNRKTLVRMARSAAPEKASAA